MPVEEDVPFISVTTSSVTPSVGAPEHVEAEAVPRDKPSAISTDSHVESTLAAEPQPARVSFAEPTTPALLAPSTPVSQGASRGPSPLGSSPSPALRQQRSGQSRPHSTYDIGARRVTLDVASSSLDLRSVASSISTIPRSLSLTDVNRAGAEHPEAPLGTPPTSKKHQGRKSIDNPVVGIKVDEHHKNYMLMYDMLSGIRVTLSRCHARAPRPLEPADFTSAQKLAFDVTGNELLPYSRYDFKFKDYAPWVFRFLREFFGIDAADYLVSLTGKYMLSELGSPGKSGSFFYFSADYRFIIKTISHTEHAFFRQILADYYEYVKNNPNTLLARFYGLHRVKLPHGRKIHFVVMGNIFPPNRDIHETYDLKGSTVGRYTEPSADGSARIMKDINFLESHKKLQLGPAKRKLFVEQIEKDAQFLAKHNIMDYSLLLGIHDLTRGNKEDLRNRQLAVFQPTTVSNNVKDNVTKYQRKAIKKAISGGEAVGLETASNRLPETSPSERKGCVFYQDDGGFISTDENDQPLEEIYHMGVIDILTPYNTLKRMEHSFRSLRNDPEKISAVEPNLYARRFVSFLINGVAQDPPSTPRHKRKLHKSKSDSSESVSDIQLESLPKSPVPTTKAAAPASSSAPAASTVSAATVEKADTNVPEVVRILL